VVEAGHIIERGTHEQLYAAGGRYYELYTKQHGVAANLFLAPGEGDKVLEAGADAEPSAAAMRVETVPEAVRLLRGRDR
jgi:subfamily B ATP-binding cassette protein MsbA